MSIIHRARRAWMSVCLVPFAIFCKYVQPPVYSYLAPMKGCEQKYPVILTLGLLDIAPPLLTAIRKRHWTYNPGFLLSRLWADVSKFQASTVRMTVWSISLSLCGGNFASEPPSGEDNLAEQYAVLKCVEKGREKRSGSLETFPAVFLRYVCSQQLIRRVRKKQKRKKKRLLTFRNLASYI